MWTEPRFGVTERALGHMVLMHTFIRWAKHRAIASGDAAVEDGMYLVEGNWWRDLTDETRRDPAFAVRVIDILAASEDANHRILAGDLLSDHHIYLAKQEQIADPAAEVTWWRRLFETERDAEVLDEHSQSFMLLMEDLQSRVSDDGLVSAQPFLEQLQAFAEQRFERS